MGSTQIPALTTVMTRLLTHVPRPHLVIAKTLKPTTSNIMVCRHVREPWVGSSFCMCGCVGGCACVRGWACMCVGVGVGV